VAALDALYKYLTTDAARKVLVEGSLRWVSPALVEDPWFIGYQVDLGFDHETINKAMLKTAVSMIFDRELPSGNREHPLYKAICRWRAEERFNNETEAWDALSELLAPTPETLQQKLNKITDNWQETVANARVLSFADNPKVMSAWQHQADNFKGVALRFEPSGSFSDAKPVEYSNQRPHLTTVKEQVNDLVGIERANVEGKFESKLLTNGRHLSFEKEVRCVRIFDEEDLDCGEDIEDWYMDEAFAPEQLTAVYFGFAVPDYEILEIGALLETSYPGTTLYRARKIDEQYDIEFDKISLKDAAEPGTQKQQVG
jgi:hypothetical protein